MDTYTYNWTVNDVFVSVFLCKLCVSYNESQDTDNGPRVCISVHACVCMSVCVHVFLCVHECLCVCT